jgi:hypothetical protein
MLSNVRPLDNSKDGPAFAFGMKVLPKMGRPFFALRAYYRVS